MMEERLITEVSRHPILYNQNLEDYKDNDLKNNTWLQITEKLMGSNETVAVEKLKQRWKSLRDTYIKTLRKKRNRNGQAISKMRPWRFEKEMEFLQPFIFARDIVPAISSEDNDSIVEEKFNHTNLDSGQNDFPFSAHSSEQLTAPPSSKRTSKLCISNSRNNIQNNILAEDVTEFLKRYVEDRHILLTKEQDPVDAFFLGISQTVKRLNPISVALIKKKVANLVMDEELRQLEKTESTNKLEYHIASPITQTHLNTT